MRPAEGLKKPRLCLQGGPHAGLPTRTEKPCTRSCLFTTLPNPNRQTSQPTHSTSQPEGDQGKDLTQLHRDRQGHLECDPGGITETMVSTHTGTASRVGETLSVCLPGRWHHRTGSGQVLSHKQTGPRRGLSPAPQRQPGGPGVWSGGPEPTVSARGRVAVSPAMGDIGNVLTDTAPQGCTGAKCRQALGSPQQSLSQ